MIGQGAMMMAEGGETDHQKGYIFGGKHDLQEILMI